MTRRNSERRRNLEWLWRFPVPIETDELNPELGLWLVNLETGERVCISGSSSISLQDISEVEL